MKYLFAFLFSVCLMLLYQASALAEPADHCGPQCRCLETGKDKCIYRKMCVCTYTMVSVAEPSSICQCPQTCKKGCDVEACTCNIMQLVRADQPLAQPLPAGEPKAAEAIKPKPAIDADDSCGVPYFNADGKQCGWKTKDGTYYSYDSAKQTFTACATIPTDAALGGSGNASFRSGRTEWTSSRTRIKTVYRGSATNSCGAGGGGVAGCQSSSGTYRERLLIRTSGVTGCSGGLCR